MSGKVAIVMGSKTDSDIMAAASAALDEFGIANETLVISAHRTRPMRHSSSLPPPKKKASK